MLSKYNKTRKKKEQLFFSFWPLFYLDETKLLFISKKILSSVKFTKKINETSAPHSPRRQKLNLRMKSLSLDSPESSELHGNMRGNRRYPPGTIGGPSGYHGGSGGHLEHSTPPSNNSRNNSRLHCKLVYSHFSFSRKYSTRADHP
jgi:hypothetical protein